MPPPDRRPDGEPLPRPIEPLDLNELRTSPITSRRHLVQRDQLARPVDLEDSLSEFLACLPRAHAVNHLLELADAIAAARAADRPVLFGLGGHVVKVGLTPLIADLVERGLITGLVLNGSTAIHDVEIALLGETSEAVSETIVDGRFGMVTETAAVFARVFERGAAGVGLGHALAEELEAGPYPFKHDSLILRAARAGAVVTVHVALGTDTVHAVPGASGAAIGEASHLDFRRLAAAVCDLSDGVYVNVGSAVVLPEVFLKAVSVARNLGHAVSGLTTANLDMIQHYRPRKNVLERPAERGIAITGHHELTVPLLRAAILAAQSESKR